MQFMFSNTKPCQLHITQIWYLLCSSVFFRLPGPIWERERKKRKEKKHAFKS